MSFSQRQPKKTRRASGDISNCDFSRFSRRLAPTLLGTGNESERSMTMLQERYKNVKTETQKTVTLGELVSTVFDKAAQ